MKKEIAFLLFLILMVSCTQQPNVETNPEEITIGYIGCSNTRETVEGYYHMGGKKMWSYERRYGSGTILDWSRNLDKGSKYWKVFDELLEKHPNTKSIWWELCIMDEDRTTNYENAEIVVKEIRTRIPNVTIYVSALADYTDGLCEITGTWGLEKGKELMQELDAKNENIFLGPVLGPMSKKETAKDGCHLSSPDGKRKLGIQLKDFFDNIENSTINKTIVEPIVEQVEEQEEIELSFEEKVWQERVNAALESSPCPEIPKVEYPNSYYLGPLIDTHLHIPAIPDHSPGEQIEEIQEGRFGGPKALLGWNVKMSEIVCTLKNEGTKKNFAFFQVYEGEISLYLLEIWNRTMNQYPESFTPFIMSSGNDNEPNGFPTVDAKILTEMLKVHPNLFKGYGEIGLYERENGGSKALPPDSNRLIQIYPIVRENNLLVYFHLGEGDKDNFERILKQNPDINFIWHGDQLSVNEVDDILAKYQNAYYGIDEFFGGEREVFELYVGKSKDDYLKIANKNFDKIIQQAVNYWKPLIEKHPDRVLWGTDRGDAVWNYDLEVGQMQVKIARAFIGKLDANIQENFAYKNAERLINISGKN